MWAGEENINCASKTYLAKYRCKDECQTQTEISKKYSSPSDEGKWKKVIKTPDPQMIHAECFWDDTWGKKCVLCCFVFEPESFLFYVTGDVEAAKITDSSWVITESLKTDVRVSKCKLFPQLWTVFALGERPRSDSLSLAFTFVCLNSKGFLKVTHCLHFHLVLNLSICLIWAM